MKQLTCEMCGSTDLLKQDGVFVCQTCGTKCSIEEAKKMMVEGLVDVSGSTVKVDASTKLKNLYTLARRAKDNDNIRDAAKYYHEIMLEDPNSWEAVFYSAYFKALDCKISQISSAILSVGNTMGTVSVMIQSHVPQESQKTAYTECLLRVVHAGQIMVNATVKAYKDSNCRDARSDFNDRMSKCLAVTMTAGSTAEKMFNDYKLAYTIYSKALAMCKSCNSPIIVSVQTRLRAIQPKVNEEYWENHADEKKKLEAERHKLQEEIDKNASVRDSNQNIVDNATEKRDKRIALEKKNVVQIEEELAAKKKQLSELGLFKGKLKKELRTEIEAKTKEHTEAEEKFNRVCDKANEDYLSETQDAKKTIDESVDKINAAKKELYKIDAKLENPL